MSLTIQYCSDLHLEFPENKQYITRHYLEPGADILVLAGDILLLSMMGEFNDFFDHISATYPYTYWIPGNHEYYGVDIAAWPSPLSTAIRHNVFLVNRHTFLHQDVAISCCTLWSHISPLHELRIQQSLSDFSYIRYNGSRLSIADYNAMHQADLEWLKCELHTHAGMKHVVVTHHVPTIMNYPRKFLNSPINDAFVSEQQELIHKTGPQYWMYGHHHVNIPGFKVGHTTLLTNQLGYIRHYEHKLYKRRALIEL